MVERTNAKVTFAIKAHRSMTHERVAGSADIQQFNDALVPLREAGVLGAVLAQFPHSFHQTAESRGYLKRLVDGIGRPVVVELRSDGWSADPILDWFSRIGVGFCCVDEPRIQGLMPPVVRATGSPAYVRFHGRNAAKWYNHDEPHERYDYRYRDDELAQWVPGIRSLETAAAEVLVFFNNHFQAKAVDGARALTRLLGGSAWPDRRGGQG
jgi:uncharacterized protein YecE (DUF72 family)